MERVDKHVGAVYWKSSCDATIAESGHDVGFGGAVEPCRGEPCRQRDEGGCVHID